MQVKNKKNYHDQYRSSSLFLRLKKIILSHQSSQVGFLIIRFYYLKLWWTYARGRLGSKNWPCRRQVGSFLINNPRSYEPNDFRLITGPKCMGNEFWLFFVSAHAREQKK